MATYTPAVLRTPTAITATFAKVIDLATDSIVRTFNFNVLTTAHSVYLSQGTGGEGTAILQSYLLTANVPYIVNGWYFVPEANFWETKADSVATNAPAFGAWGYTYA